MNTAFMMLLESAETQAEGAINRIQHQPDAASQLADPDYWGSVGILTVTGLLVVFLILAILIFFFWLMGTIFKAIDKSKAAKKAVEAEKPAAPTPVVEAAEAVQEDDPDDEEEIVAVISAAIAAYSEADGTAYTIKSIRRHRDNRSRSAWSMAGISGNMREF